MHPPSLYREGLFASGMNKMKIYDITEPILKIDIKFLSQKYGFSQ